MLGINFVRDLYNNETEKLFTWQQMLQKGFKQKHFICWSGIILSLPNSWRHIQNVGCSIQSSVCKIDNLDSKTVYWKFIEHKSVGPSKQDNRAPILFFRS